ncbi:MAG: hypothetical protein ABI821_10445 [Pseudomonadota bacterium]
MRIAGTIFACLLSATLISGCKSRMVSCRQDNKDYAGAKELPPLTAPAGLEVPNTRNSLKVPPLNTPERVRARDEGCLDTPPPFATPKSTDAPKPS